MSKNVNEMSIEEIENEMAEIKQYAKRGGKIAFVAVPGGLSIIGFILLFEGIFILSHVGYGNSGGIALLSIGSMMSLMCIIISLSGISPLKEANRNAQRYGELKERRKYLLINSTSDDSNVSLNGNIIKDETSEDTLLRLLSEGKITIEEYKKLSNKK